MNDWLKLIIKLTNTSYYYHLTFVYDKLKEINVFSQIKL